MLGFVLVSLALHVCQGAKIFDHLSSPSYEKRYFCKSDQAGKSLIHHVTTFLQAI